MSMPKRPTVTKGKKNAKYELSSTLNTVISHYKGRTIQEIVDSDSNGDNINHLLRYRAAGDGSLTERGYPFRYHDFSDEVNVTLDVYLYANPPLLQLYKPRFTKGELTLKLKEIDTESRQRREREIREFQEAERQKLEEYMQEARKEEERRTKYSGEWGALVMSKPKVSVAIVSIDNDQDKETGNFVRIRDYDRHIFLFIHVLFTDNGPCVKIRKEFISSEVMDKFYEEKKQYYVDDGGWNIRLTSSFNPTVEMLTDEKAFEKRFGPILGEAETHHTFKHSIQRELKDCVEQYQIKTAREGAW